MVHPIIQLYTRSQEDFFWFIASHHRQSKWAPPLTFSISFKASVPSMPSCWLWHNKHWGIHDSSGWYCCRSLPSNFWCRYLWIHSLVRHCPHLKYCPTISNDPMLSMILQGQQPAHVSVHTSQGRRMCAIKESGCNGKGCCCEPAQALPRSFAVYLLEILFKGSKNRCRVDNFSYFMSWFSLTACETGENLWQLLSYNKYIYIYE